VLVLRRAGHPRDRPDGGRPAPAVDRRIRGGAAVVTTWFRWFFLCWAVWIALVSWYYGLVPTEGMGLFALVLIIVFLKIAQTRAGPRHG
jgi:hypothetical protein